MQSQIYVEPEDQEHHAETGTQQVESEAESEGMGDGSAAATAGDEVKDQIDGKDQDDGAECCGEADVDKSYLILPAGMFEV